MRFLQRNVWPVDNVSPTAIHFFVKTKNPRNSHFYISSSLKQISTKLHILCKFFFFMTNSFLNLFFNLITYFKV